MTSAQTNTSLSLGARAIVDESDDATMKPKTPVGYGAFGTAWI